MRTNIELDEALIKEAQRLSGLRSMRETVDVALREYVAWHRQQGVLALAGQGLIANDYDVRAVRASMADRTDPSHGAG